MNVENLEAVASKENLKSDGEEKLEKLVEAVKVKFDNDAEKSDLIKILNYARSLYRKSTLSVDAKITPNFDELLSECKNSIEKSCDVYNSILNLVSYLKTLLIAKTTSVALNDNENLKTKLNGSASPVAASDQHKPKRAILIDARNDREPNSVEPTPKKQRISDPEPSPSKPSTSMEVGETNPTKSEDLLVGISKKEEIALDNIIKLDKLLEQLNKKIVEYEKSEISLDEEKHYVIESELKKRFMKAHRKMVNLCKQYPHLVHIDNPKTLKKKSGQFSKKIKFNHTRYQEINKKITESLNKLKCFPDYADVCDWIEQANNDERLGLSKDKIEEISKEAFEEIGRILKKQRIEDDKSVQKSRLQSLNCEVTSDIDAYDPADENPDLHSKLLQNKKIASEKHEKIIAEYVQKQNEQPNGVDKEDDEDDSEEDEDEDDLEKSHPDESENEPDE